MYKIGTRKNQNTLTAIVEGYCNQEAGDELVSKVQLELESGNTRNLILNFADCSGVNSPGVARILEITEMVIEDFNGRVFICGLDKVKTSFFEMVGILELAKVLENEAEALKSISSD